MATHYKNVHRQQRGFSLIEVLVTLVLIAVGVLGMLAMQTQSIKYTTDTSSRTNAVILVDDLFEIMRADRNALYGPKYQLKQVSSYYKTGAELVELLNTGSCSSGTKADQALCQWLSRYSAIMPISDRDVIEKDFYICRSQKKGSCTKEKGRMIEVKVAWQARQGECGDSAVCTYSIRSEI